ncbi:UDP-N-acetylmuramoyl-tripeptide--D-alanyl-D-alanine ligase [Vibrio sonorensis]|uniref:UDP-N-acetylmuramoyl-tripeptide--D-alanyl-D- alanine ligase n=1 Tax=Vibrio sonorensis TaxID=1004316 RepID=UPI0008DB3225|nr:UDP-N-acetylmuramoyl-tripeptide--D-alanyl-D-alanine ligase [Vibrio sonorensis]
MISISLSQIETAVSGELVGQDKVINSVSTDTRAIENDALFIALVGERFDAHDFAQKAVDSGAGALIVSRKLDIDVPQILVKDTKQALGKLGALVHHSCDTPTIAITGSCGKTTVKEMVASILAYKGQVMFTAGNFNNDIGVPLTLLRSTPEDDFAVIELGANHIGEIAYTTELVQPDVALVNNVAAAHLEGFGSIDGVKQAKGEIYQGLKAGSTALVNLDSQGGGYWDSVLRDKQVRTLSMTNTDADFYPTDIELTAQGHAHFVLHTPQGSAKVKLGIVGKHNIANALAAAALALEMGSDLASIVTGLADVKPVKGRVEVIELTPKLTLIDDSYNASVPAMKAAVELLSGFESNRWLVLGNMAEMGEESLELHREVGKHAAPFKFEQVLTYGDDTKAISDVCGGKHFLTHQELIDFIQNELDVASTTNTILVKGALSAQMSQVAEAVKEMYS